MNTHAHTHTHTHSHNTVNTINPQEKGEEKIKNSKHPQTQTESILLNQGTDNLSFKDLVMNTNLFRTMSPANLLNPLRTKGNWMLGGLPIGHDDITPRPNHPKSSDLNKFQNNYTRPFVIKKTALNSFIHLQGSRIPLKNHKKC